MRLINITIKNVSLILFLLHITNMNESFNDSGGQPVSHIKVTVGCRDAKEEHAAGEQF